jgi:chromosome segregation ATPase
LGQRVSKWLGAPVARHIEHEVQEEHGLVPARRWDGAVGDLIFRLRDRAGFVQRALTAQARELKEWVIEHTRSTQAEVDQLREQVSTQQVQVEELTAQLQDLRALVTSQQKVLMYMGKDMELAQPAELELSSCRHARFHTVTVTRNLRETDGRLLPKHPRLPTSTPDSC